MLVDRLLLLLRIKNNDSGGYPRVTTLTDFVPDGVLFEVSNGVEAHRIEDFGGEEAFTRQILEQVQPGRTLLDIGACVGLVTVHAAKLGADVYAFEPDPYYRSRLKKNLRLNELDQVTVVPWAVSDTAGEAELFTDGAGGNSPSLRKVGERGREVVQTDTIDDALKRGEIRAPDLVKIDIEGAEILALRGMQGLLRSTQAPRVIFMEVHPQFLGNFGSSPDEVMELVQSFGYRTVQMVESHDQIHCIFVKGA
ncbi:FkbM family methyltransferase [Citrifermentans bremense]|uniref:FkbM family methyltransferase n=1 Tax=Citrifermentans bremense TaxID=60035 RepID=UPI001CF7E29A|nr:FkbM family methyltransferase [Citrifermentans bremense]